MNKPLTQMDLAKRKLLVGLAAFTAYQLLPNLVFANPIEAVATAQDLGGFLQLSTILTGYALLDKDTARLILIHIRTEPWGKEHIAQVSAKVLPSSPDNTGSTTRRQRLDMTKFSEGERWFIGHLMTTWFTGVYYHQSGNHVISYHNALMHAAIQDIRPIPGYSEGGAFGFWAEPPVGAAQ
ncbi:MAG: sugar dehydrogenase complex small subunit [Gallionella sp.]|nr:sugar dehydrogenase complex small subunit [Gallionella sp.]MDD4959446.1 sugar dehydrogenase complex small subunit [Gallionella sp.]